MRTRRGNYTLLFIVTSGILFAFMALAIDIGRLRAARVSVENAAEAGTYAALMEIRRGSSRGRATISANRATNFVMGRGLAGGVAGMDAIVDIDWGEWRWNQARDNAWRETPTGQQAVTVTAKTGNGGIQTLFYPLAAALTGGDTTNGGRVVVAASARAAMRNRDIVVGFDISRMSRFTDENLSQAVGDMLDAVIAQRIPGDRISLVAYTGDSWIYDATDPSGLVAIAGSVGSVVDSISATEPGLANALFDVQLTQGPMSGVVQSIQPCWMGPEVYHRLHRFFVPGAFDDLELPGVGIQYGFLGADPFLNAYPTVPWNDPNFASARQWLGGPSQVNQAEWDAWYAAGQGVAPGSGATAAQQCDVWLAGLAHWLEMDPRVRENEQLSPGNVRSPLSCHAGSELAMTAGDLSANDYSPLFDVPEVVGCHGNLTFIDHTTGVAYPAWNFDDPVGDDAAFGGVPGTDVRDIRFAWAGSNPGSFLQTAADILEARVDQSREPVVILVAGTEPQCGPNLEPRVSGFCEETYIDQFAFAAGRLNQLEAHFYIAGNVDLTNGFEGVAGDFLYAASTTGRGYYELVTEPDALSELLQEFVSDVSIQIVQ